MTTSRYYIKQLTSAELGEAKTHEKYIRLTNDFPYEEFFQTAGYQNGTVTQIDFTAYDKENANEAISLKFIYYSNSNKEKRIPSIGNIFDARGVKVNDVVVLESVTTDGETKIYISFMSPERISLNPSTIYYTVTKDEDYVPDLNVDLPLQQIIFGAPGTGKSFSVDKDTRRYKVFRTTFHPDSDYSTFVGTYKPIMVEKPVMTTIGTKRVQVEDANGKPVTESQIEYKFVPQAFAQAYVKAWKNINTPVFLVIEEINRGNCAQIFGDIFQLLDRRQSGFSSYNITPDKDLQQYLYQVFAEQGIDEKAHDVIRLGMEMCLPPNLYIWATMNTSDQSLFPIDSAFKRRWEWKYIKIKDEHKDWKIEANGSHFDWWDFLEFVNTKIGESTSSEDKKMGYYFAKADKNGIISAATFVSKVIFYLTNDVFKDYDTDIFNVNDRTLTFQDFFDENGDVDETVLEDFIRVHDIAEW